MPFDVEMPDGTVIEGVPDGTPKDVIRQKWVASIQAADRAQYSPTEGMGMGEKIAAGAGRAVVNVGRGIRQIGANIADAVSPRNQGLGDLVTGRDPSRSAALNAEVSDARALDAPLMATGAGKFGDFLGNAALAAPTAFIPGVNSVTGASLVGAGLGLVQPAESAAERVANTALGGAAGGIGQKIGQVVAPKIGQAIARRTQAAAEAKSANSVRDQVLAEARKVGYKAPPATVNQTSAVARATESLAGKAAMKQTAAVHNQQVTNRLVREELGLPKSAPLSTATLEGIRKNSGKAYQAVKESGDILADQQYLQEIDSLGNVADEVAKDFPGFDVAGSAEIQKLREAMGQQGFSAKGAVEMMKELRHEASKNLAWNVDDPARKALGLAQREAAGILEDQVIRHLEQQGKGGLAKAFDRARTTIAKTYSVQAALNEGSGNVVAGKLGAQLRKGKPLSGNLEKIARFASSVESGVVKEEVGSPGVSALVASLASAGGAYGLATGNPALGAAAAGTLLSREAARRLLLSRAGQRLAAPSYAPRNALLGTMQRLAPLSAPVGIGLANAEQ